MDRGTFPLHFQWWNVRGCPNRQLQEDTQQSGAGRHGHQILSVLQVSASGKQEETQPGWGTEGLGEFFCFLFLVSCFSFFFKSFLTDLGLQFGGVTAQNDGDDSIPRHFAWLR